MSGRRWTTREVELLRAYAAGGVDTRGIAATLHRDVTTVRAKAYRESVPLAACRSDGELTRAERLLRTAERRSRERGWRP